jgi:hypothetical protein
LYGYETKVGVCGQGVMRPVKLQATLGFYVLPSPGLQKTDCQIHHVSQGSVTIMNTQDNQLVKRKG